YELLPNEKQSPSNPPTKKRCKYSATAPDPSLKSAAAPAQRAGTTSLSIMDVVTKKFHRCQPSGWKYQIHARKRP
ncbi:hypothetical protein KZI67_RS25275, partial [Escherichia coli]